MDAQCRRKDEWKAITRRSILEAVVRLISMGGIQGLTMERVAAEAGVAKGTLYLYFKDKDRLLDEAKSACLRPMLEEILSILDGDLPPDRKLECFVALHLGAFERNREFLRVFALERPPSSHPRDRQRSLWYRAYVDRVARVLEEGMRSGLFRPVDAATVAAMIVESEIAVAWSRLAAERPRPLEEDANLVLEVFLHGLSRGAAPSRRKV